MPPPRRASEFELIERYFAPLAAGAAGALGLADDAATLAVEAGRELVVTVDMLVAGVHFLPADPPELVARKLLRVNLSDLAAMGARPRGYVLAVAWPHWIDEPWVAAFAGGLAADQAAFGITLLGGDTVATEGMLTLSLTAFGDVAAGAALRRRGARVADDIYVSGTIGDAALGLRALQGRLGHLRPGHIEALAGRYHLPEPRLALGARLAGLATAAIDISDGLVADLGHVCAASGVGGARLTAAAVPLSAAARAALAAEPELIQSVLGGGDDYELLFTAPPGRADAVAALAAELGLALSCIGHITAAGGIEALDTGGKPIRLDRAGYTHF